MGYRRTSTSAENVITGVGVGIGCIAIFAAVVAITAWLFMLLWNAVVNGIFHGPMLTYWQAALVWLFIGMIGSLFRGSSSSK